MLKIGHRGASGSSPENTLAAFEKALALGADGVELDVHRLKCGALAVIHDDTVNRTTNGDGRVAELTLAQIRALDAGGGERVPTLEEALAALKGAYCFIEVKHADAAVLVAEQVEHALSQGYAADRLWVISFRREALAKAQAAFPTLNTGMSFEQWTPNSIRDAYAAGARAIIPSYRLLTAGRVRKAHEVGLKVICWTVNEPAHIVQLKPMKVDGIMSDYPERLGSGE